MTVSRVSAIARVTCLSSCQYLFSGRFLIEHITIAFATKIKMRETCLGKNNILKTNHKLEIIFIAFQYIMETGRKLQYIKCSIVSHGLWLMLFLQQRFFN